MSKATSLGIVGFLSVWEVDMDIVTMVSIVMAIGLTIDYAAHICYNFFISDVKLSATVRMAECIDGIAYPIFQVFFFLFFISISITICIELSYILE